MWEYKQTNELYHAGVKGMKWGVRKAGVAPEPMKPPKYAKTGQNNQAKSERARANGKTAAAAALGVLGGFAISATAVYAGARWFIKRSGLENGLFGNGW